MCSLTHDHGPCVLALSHLHNTFQKTQVALNQTVCSVNVRLVWRLFSNSHNAAAWSSLRHLIASISSDESLWAGLQTTHWYKCLCLCCGAAVVFTTLCFFQSSCTHGAPSYWWSKALSLTHLEILYEAFSMKQREEIKTLCCGTITVRVRTFILLSLFLQINES